MTDEHRKEIDRLFARTREQILEQVNQDMLKEGYPESYRERLEQAQFSLPYFLEDFYEMIDSNSQEIPREIFDGNA